MKIKFISSLSGKEHIQDVNITEEQLKARREGAKVQDCFPHLSLMERDFFVLGTTPEEWESLYAEEEEIKEQAANDSEFPQYIKDWFDL